LFEFGGRVEGGEMAIYLTVLPPTRHATDAKIEGRLPAKGLAEARPTAPTTQQRGS
jgi:hypothetical protein